MKAIILIFSFLLASSPFVQKPVYAQSKTKAFSLIGEWERTDNLTEGNSSKLIFYPDGKLNILNKKRSEMRLVRYRLLSEKEPLKGEILLVPFGEGQPQDRIPFTVTFTDSQSINFTYLPGNILQTLLFKKVKDIEQGIVPLSD
ncbi:hypothetical protein AHMF7605_15110 [Adhaeribacter arboris]|uniref:DUF4488 domain-containing protein n=1 Tax=Adhaeribacter arboris TaxID=2072846 RepID=A0A2T2YGW2_9BACT|nr:hypothetical protein [Adhaeribacter arboris]PSR54740.1 hypothetical protein AHMF7605_15110 [Adhaeribacter arboris]